ncbi:MAG: hypothetical protein ACKOWK_01180, partial [Micrococcales bacterium]
ILLFGFLLPVVRYLTKWTDVTTARVVLRSGIWGQHYRAVSLAAVERVEQNLGVITLFVRDEAAMELRGLAKPRIIAQEISNLTARTAGQHPASFF